MLKPSKRPFFAWKIIIRKIHRISIGPPTVRCSGPNNNPYNFRERERENWKNTKLVTCTKINNVCSITKGWFSTPLIQPPSSPHPAHRLQARWWLVVPSTGNGGVTIPEQEVSTKWGGVFEPLKKNTTVSAHLEDHRQRAPVFKRTSSDSKWPSREPQLTCSHWDVSSSYSWLSVCWEGQGVL